MFAVAINYRMPPRIGPRRPTRHFIREWRLAKGLSQDKLANLLDTSKGQISNWENDKRGVHLEVLGAVVYALGVEPDQLLRPPQNTSLDSLLKNATPAQREQAIAVVETLLRTGTK